MHNKQPRISIITVVYNGVNFLEETIQSVLNQSYEHIEYIIIDGGSTDGTVDIIKRYEDKIDYWVSERDEGIYDAMNKGMVVATGDFVNFMNGGDVICEVDSVEKVVSAMRNTDAVYFARAKVIEDSAYYTYPSKKVADYKKWLRLSLPNHQSMFFPKKFYSLHSYDLRLKLTADDDYKLWALKKHQTIFIDRIFVIFGTDGISSKHGDIKLFLQRLKESYIRNSKHHRWLRVLVDPFKLSLMFLIDFLLGEKYFSNFLKIVSKIKE